MSVSRHSGTHEAIDEDLFDQETPDGEFLDDGLSGDGLANTPDDHMVVGGSAPEEPETYEGGADHGGSDEPVEGLHPVNGEFEDDESEDDDDEWMRAPSPEPPEPKPLRKSRRRVPPFNDALLPNPLGRWARDIAERMHVPLDFVAVAAMVMLAGLVGRSLGIRPKRFDDWVVAPTLWGLAIGPSGTKKTPAMRAALRPLEKLDDALRAEHEGAEAEYRLRVETYDAVKGNLNKALKEAALSGSPEALEEAQEAHRLHHPGPPPGARRLLVHDATPEALQELMATNPRGLTEFRDEIIGWTTSMEKPGREGERKFVLEAWDGTGSYSSDRIGRGATHVPRVAFSVMGGTQEGPWQKYVDEATQDGRGADGFLQRFQLTVYPDPCGPYEHVDRPPDAEAAKAVDEVAATLLGLDPGAIGAAPDDDEVRGIPYLRFSDEAQPVFDGWLIGLEERLHANEEAPAFQSHLSKYRSLVPSIALLVHLCEGGRGPVSRSAVERAVGWAEYLEAQARRVYDGGGCAEDPTVSLAKKIVAGDVVAPGGSFTARDVYRHKWSGLGSPEVVKDALGALVEAGWLTRQDESWGPGRPSYTYRVVDGVYDRHHELLPEAKR